MFDVAQLTERGHSLAVVDVRRCSDDELFDGVRGLAALRSLVEAAEAHALAELDTRGATDRVHGSRTVAWAAAETGQNRGSIHSRLKVGRALRHPFDLVDDAVCDGRLSFDHAKALVDVANPRCAAGLAAAQDQIIDLAEGATFAAWKRDVAALAELADTDGVEPDPYAGNELRLPKTLDGRTEVNGTFDAANGLAVRTAIDDKTDELFRRFTRDAETTADLAIPGRAILRALALAELIRTAVGAEPGSRSLPRAEVTLIAHGDEICGADGTPLPKTSIDVWGCDPGIWAVVLDHMGIPVDVGRAARLATVAQRHAIAVRDGGCTFPGCDAPIAWCDMHHAHDWHHGGPTDLDNLVALCRHHHGVTHRNGWTMTLDHRQVPHWTTPSGDHLVGQRHGRPVPAVLIPIEHTDDGPRPPRPEPDNRDDVVVELRQRLRTRLAREDRTTPTRMAVRIQR